MTAHPKDGGPAFPCDPLEFHYGNPNGMSLHDYFAAKAMQAAATSQTGANGFSFESRATWAYRQSDAMLKAREVQS